MDDEPIELTAAETSLRGQFTDALAGAEGGRPGADRLASRQTAVGLPESLGMRLHRLRAHGGPCAAGLGFFV